MKKAIALLLSVMMILAAVSAAAETKITVSGTGEVRISADTAVISLGVNARDKDVLKAQQKVNDAIAAIRKALTELNVKEENIHTEFINLYAVYDYQNDQEQVAAYNASSTLGIKVSDMDQIGTLIDAAFSAGANTLNGITFAASDTETAKAEAMKAAAEDAKKKAEILAAASGLTLSGIDTISDGGVYSYENNIGNVYAKGMDRTEAAEDAGTVVQAAKLIVSATVTIVFNAE